MSDVKLVGILNVTPDSFSDGGLYQAPADAIQHADDMFSEGAWWVDVGAESTRPGAVPISPASEWERLAPVLSVLIPRYAGRICVDSYHPETHRRAAELGKFIVNDVTGFNNVDMVDTASELYKNGSVVKAIASNLPFRFGANIQKAHQEKHQAVTDARIVRKELLLRKKELMQAGIAPEDIIADPGIGFGKTRPLNWQLLHFAKVIHETDPSIAVMIGYSRKSFLGFHPGSDIKYPFGDKIRLSDEANLEAGKTAVNAGAAYLRVHDVGLYRNL